MLNYLTPLIAFGAVMLAIRGGTWNDEFDGWQRLRPTGWLSLLLGLAACVVSLIQTHSASRKFQWQEHQKAEVRAIAEGEIHEELRRILWPFEILYDEVENDFDAIPEFDRDGYANLNRWSECLIDKKFMGKFKNYDLQKRPAHSDPSDSAGNSLTWAQAFFRSTSKSMAGIDATLQKYAMYLDAETIIDIKRLQRHEFTALSLLLNMEPWAKSETPRDAPNEVLISNVFFGQSGYEPYIDFIRLSTGLMERLPYPRWRKETEDKIRKYNEANKANSADAKSRAAD
jgi:hypothetical protein